MNFTKYSRLLDNSALSTKPHFPDAPEDEQFVILRGDENLKYHSVMDVIDEIKQAGVDKLALATKEE